MNSLPPPAAVGTPSAEIAIDIPFAAALIAEQHPDLAHLPLSRGDEGWDNVMFRLGDELAVRLPRRALGATLIVHEQTWLPLLAEHLTLPVPAPVRVGTPTGAYPSIVPWISGATADQAPPHADQARRLAEFLAALHRPAPDGAPVNPHRGCPLQARAEWDEPRLHRLATSTDLITPAIRAAWQTALAAPLDAPRTWLHGDLHPRNVLVDQGRLSGVIDWGDLTAGDCATDLATIWMLFADAADRRAVWEAYPVVSEPTRARAMGWAVVFGAILLDTGRIDNPVHARIGEQTLRRVAEDAGR
jgi:aminoglycoside phosphotransferase (APT) family kinase protein